MSFHVLMTTDMVTFANHHRRDHIFHFVYRLGLCHRHSFCVLLLKIACFGSALSRLIICFCSHLESFPGWRVCRGCVGACGSQPNLTQPTAQGHRRTALVPPLKTFHDSSDTYVLVPEFWGLDEICFWSSSSWEVGEQTAPGPGS